MAFVTVQQQQGLNVDGAILYEGLENGSHRQQHHPLVHSGSLLTGVGIVGGVDRKFPGLDASPRLTFEHNQRLQHLARCGDSRSDGCSNRL